PVRDFARGPFRLREAPRALRTTYLAFLVLVALGLVTQLVVQVGRIGVTPAAIARYYRGGGSGDAKTLPKALGALPPVAHAHAVMMAVIFLVLAHLFASASIGERARAITLAVAFAGTVGDLLAPWLVRYVAAWCAWIALASWVAMGAGYLALVAVSAWECVGG